MKLGRYTRTIFEVTQRLAAIESVRPPVDPERAEVEAELAAAANDPASGKLLQAAASELARLIANRVELEVDYVRSLTLRIDRRQWAVMTPADRRAIRDSIVTLAAWSHRLLKDGSLNG